MQRFARQGTALVHGGKPVALPSAAFPKHEMLRRAEIEDEIMDILLRDYSKLVLHGSTAIRRCYNGDRFTTDLDFYTNLKPARLVPFREQLYPLLIGAGYSMTDMRYSNMDRLLLDPTFVTPEIPLRHVASSELTLTLHVVVKKDGVSERIDMTFMTRAVKYVEAEYTRADGSKRPVYILVPEALLQEKMDRYAYDLDRAKHRIQDLYDIAFLSETLEDLSARARRNIAVFLARVREKPPGNEAELARLLMDRAAPSFGRLLETLERHCSDANG